MSPEIGMFEFPPIEGESVNKTIGMTVSAPLPNGKLLVGVPKCWCGEWMHGRQLPVVGDGFDINWFCPTHGNEGLEVFYIEAGGRALLNSVVAMSNHQLHSDTPSSGAMA